jgi:putative DNA primase/helicase
MTFRPDVLSEYDCLKKRHDDDEETRPPEWAAPLPLPDGLSEVATLAPEMLPEKIAPWVFDISDRMQCPPDFVGMTAMVALGSLLGNKIGVAPQLRTDWVEVSNLWGLGIGAPGIMKSPAMEEVLRALRRLEVRAHEAHKEKMSTYAAELHLWKLRKDAAEARFKHALKENPSAVFDFSDPEPAAPTERRYYVNDATYEKLGEILANNPNGVLAYRDEMVSLLKTLDAEEYAAARGFFLTAWGGLSRYTFDRIGRGKIIIEGACLSMLGSAQPGRIAEYVRRATSGGEGDDGLIQRFGYMVWPDMSPTWKDVDRFPETKARNTAWGCFVSFGSIDPGGFSGIEPRGEFGSVPFLRLDTKAHGLFLEWRRGLETRLRADSMHPSLESHLAKYRKLVPALALITHVADVGEGMIGETAMKRALALATYLETHAVRAYGAGIEAETAAAEAILAHIRGDTLKDGFSARDINRHRWSKLTDRGQVQAGLELLCDHNWIHAQAKKSPLGGRPTTSYLINPRADQQ